MREASYRMRRVNEALKELIGEAVQHRLKDPRVGFVTVTGVRATTDLRYATVYVSVLGKEEEKQATMRGLRSSEGFLQELINRELHFKRTPQLDFEYDTSIDEGMKIQALLREQERELGISLDEQEDTVEGEDADGAHPAEDDRQRAREAGDLDDAPGEAPRDDQGAGDAVEGGAARELADPEQAEEESSG